MIVNNLFRAPSAAFLTPRVATSEAPKAAGSRQLDISKIPFRLAFEVVGVNQGRLDRALAKFGWHATTQGDCSHGQGEFTGTYIRVDSPDLKLNDQTFQQVAQVMDAVKGLGAKIGDTAAMKICVSHRDLDLDTKKEIFRIHQAAEPILYKFSQNGNRFHVGHNTHNYMPRGWSLEPGNAKGNYYFCMPPSQNPNPQRVLQARNDNELNEAIKGNDRYGGKHQGYQPHSQVYQGYSEFRYFTATLDAEAARADAEVVLGMVKAAYERRWPQELATCAVGQKTPWNTYHAFMNEVVGNATSRPILEKLFKQAGGTVTEPPVSDQDRERMQHLEQKGYRFSLPRSGKEVVLEDVLAKDLTVRVQEPDQPAFSVPGKQILAYLKLENGEAAAFEPADAIQESQRMAAAGVRFFHGGSDKPIGSRVAPALLAQQGVLEAEINGRRESVRGLPKLDALAFEALGPQYTAADRATVERAMRLQEKGYVFNSTTPMRMLEALPNDKLTVTLPGGTETWRLRAAQMAQMLSAELGEYDQLPAGMHEQVRLADAMQGAGFVFSHSDGKPLRARLAVPLSLENGTLYRRGPGEREPQAFRGDFNRWALAALGRNGELEESTRSMLEDLARLRTMGVTVSTRAQITGVPDVLNALDTKQQVSALVPGSKRYVVLTTQAEMAEWARQTLAIEHGSLEQVAEAQRPMVATLARLQEQNVKFYNSNDRQVDFKTVQMEAISNRQPLRASLPNRIWWNCFPRRNITVKSLEHLEKVSRRLATPR